MRLSRRTRHQLSTAGSPTSTKVIRCFNCTYPRDRRQRHRPPPGCGSSRNAKVGESRDRIPLDWPTAARTSCLDRGEHLQ
jgi:hypothetical protein